MAVYCTIFGTDADYTGVIDAVRAIPARIDVSGPESSWVTIVCHEESSTMTLNSMRKEKPGDAFSRLILSTHNFFRTRLKQPSDMKELALNQIKSSRIAIGVVAEPELTEDDERCLLQIARVVHGVIFNGSSLIDADGQTIVSIQ